MTTRMREAATLSDLMLEMPPAFHLRVHISCGRVVEERRLYLFKLGHSTHKVVP